MFKDKKVKKTKSSDELKALLIAKAPSIFEREPAQAYVDGVLDDLVEEILAIK